MADYPESEKLHAVQDQALVLSEFVDWLQDQGIFLSSYHPDDTGPHPISETYDGLFARFFEIDTAKLDLERRAMLDHLRAANDG